MAILSEERSLDFFKDYLIPLLKIKKENFIKEVDDKLENEMNSPESKLHYLENKITELLVYENEKNSIEFYNIYQSFNSIIYTVLEDLKSDLKSRIPNCTFDFNKDKIKFDLNKKEVCLLFSKLSDLGFLNNNQSSEKDLGALIEKHFMYLNERSKTYVNIDNADGYIKKLRTESRYATPSGKLKKLFD